MNEITDPSIITAIATSASAIIGGILLIWRWCENRPRVRLCKFSESNDNAIIWKIRVNYWNKPIENCNVFFDDEHLLWDKTKTEFYTLEGVAYRGNLTISKSHPRDDAEIVVKSDNRHIVTKKFSEIKPCEG